MNSKKYYAIYFCDPIKRIRTAALIVDTEKFPLNTSIQAYSRLFPYSEAPKMKRFVSMHPKSTWDEAFNAVQNLLNNNEAYNYA
jgi:hypothetical protein